MLTLMQLYELGQNVHTDIFSGITLPEDSPLDRETLINSIMERCGLNIPLYADPYVMTSAINLWSAKNQYTFEHVGKILTASYSPIENTEKFEDITITHKRDMTDNTKGNNSKDEAVNTKSNDVAKETHSGTDSNVTENTTSAFNKDTYQPDNKSLSNLTHGETINNTNDVKTDSTRKTTGNITNDKTVKEDENTRTLNHTHGNIGVMSNQSMLREEFGLLHDYNPYTFLAGLFENDLTLYIY